MEGHAFIAFENLADASGFQFFSTDKDNEVNGILGDSVLNSSISKLQATSPYPVQYTLLKDGQIIDSLDNVYSYEYNFDSTPGNYRIVASLNLNNKWTSWVITNPIYVFE